MDGGTWWAAVHGAAGSRTRLKRFSTHALSLYIPHGTSVKLIRHLDTYGF